MKKIAVLTLFFALCFCANAQEVTKKFSVIPRLGLNLSNLGDMDVYYAYNEKVTPRRRADLFAGAEVEYRVLPSLSVGVGALYSRQGCHYKSYSVTEALDCDHPSEVVIGWDNNNIVLQYLNVPVSAALHLSDNFAIKAGVQCGFFLAGNWKYDESTIFMENNIAQSASTETMNDDLKRMCRKTVWSIPVGVQFEYENVVVDVNYAIPLTGFCKDVSVGNNNYDEKMSKGSNKVLSFSVGYRF